MSPNMKKDGINEMEDLHQMKTGASVILPREVFEKMYLNPPTAVKGELRRQFANPTPLCLLGFLVTTTPLSCALMGWRGSGGGGAATNGAAIFMGGVLQILGGILEFFLGNTFPFVVFNSLGGFWLAFGATLTPFYNAAAAFSKTGSTAEGLLEPEFLASIAFWFIAMGLLCFIYLICALRTNVIFCFVLAMIVIAFGLFAGTYWQLAQGNVALAVSLEKAAGGVLFTLSLVGWYLLASLMLQALDFPFDLPVGDLTIIPSGSSQRKAAEDMA